MICTVCGLSDFALHEGILYCTECNTQIKETLDEQTDEVSFSRRSLLTGSHHLSSEISKKDKTKKFAPWLTVEGYNILLYKQVCALIKLGVSSKLKKTVLYIWSSYLEKCEIAFRTDYNASENMPRLGPFPTRRDISVLYGDNTLSFSRKRKKRKRKSVTEEKSDGEGSFSEADTDDPKLSKKNQYKFSSHAKKLHREKGKKRLKNKTRYKDEVPYQMTLPKTLCFCYLGLLYCEDCLSLTDLIRFVHEDRIPYINALDAISPPLEVVGYDLHAFVTYQIPDHYLLLKICSDLFKFLNLPEFKKPSVVLSAARVIKDLNLPDDLIHIVKVLHKQCEEKAFKSCWRWFPSDVDAHILVVIALKMLFVLDEKFEIEHSDVMKKLNTLSGDEYFVWSEWREWAMLVEYLFFPPNLEYSAINKFDSLSVEHILSLFPHLELNDSTGEGALLSRSRGQQYHYRAKKDISKMLSTFVEISPKPYNIPSSFPLQSKINSFTNEWKTLTFFKETQHMDFSFLKRNFTSCSLAFNPRDANLDDELHFLLLTSLYIPEEIQQVEKWSCHSYGTTRTSSDYWIFKNMSRLSKSENSAMLEQTPTWKWLLCFVSKYSKIGYNALQKDATRIERLLFCKSSNIPSEF